jgi:hypothetical protein
MYEWPGGYQASILQVGMMVPLGTITVESIGQAFRSDRLMRAEKLRKAFPDLTW